MRRHAMRGTDPSRQSSVPQMEVLAQEVIRLADMILLSVSDRWAFEDEDEDGDKP